MAEEERKPKSSRERMRDAVNNTRRRISGEVFHVIAGNDQLMRFRVLSDGQLSLERRFRSLNLANLVNMPKRMLEVGKEARERVVEAGKEARGRARRRWRKVVTGDPEKRIRDHLREVPQVKMIDKVSFTFGVLSICALEWLALRHADWFPWAYYSIMTVLLALRFHVYKAEKFELFMIDFCYFMNFSVILQTAFYPEHLLWFKANYVLCMGPLMIAIIIWKNSLVFHSLDKLTSFYLHAMPPLTLHLFRFGVMTNKAIKAEDTLSFAEIFLVPSGMYIIWQLGYYLITEGILSSKLEQDPELITSLRYLASDKKNGFRNLIVQILEKTGIHAKGEALAPDSIKTKAVFGITQLLYTLITILPTPFLYSSYQLSCVYFVLVFGWGTWNGASYYIEVFSERYKLQFMQVEEVSEEIEVRCGGEEREEGSIEEGSDDESEYESFENCLDQLDATEHSHLYESILALISDSQGQEKERNELEEQERNDDAQADAQEQEQDEELNKVESDVRARVESKDAENQKTNPQTLEFEKTPPASELDHNISKVPSSPYSQPKFKSESSMAKLDSSSYEPLIKPDPTLADTSEKLDTLMNSSTTPAEAKRSDSCLSKSNENGSTISITTPKLIIAETENRSEDSLITEPKDNSSPADHPPDAPVAVDPSPPESNDPLPTVLPEALQFVDPKAPDHVEPKVPDYVEPNVPEHADPKVPEYVDPKVPEYVDPKVSDHVDPKAPDYVEPKVPEYVDPELVSRLLEEAAADREGKGSGSSTGSSSNPALDTPESEKSWDHLPES